MCTLTTRKIIRGRGTDREASGYNGYNYTGGQTYFIGGTATTNSVYKISHHNRTAGAPRAPHSHTHKVGLVDVFRIRVCYYGSTHRLMSLQLSAPLEIGVRQEVSVVSDIEMDEQKAFQVRCVGFLRFILVSNALGSFLRDRQRCVRPRAITSEASAPS